jgi:hypothetical protein
VLLLAFAPVRWPRLSCGLDLLSLAAAPAAASVDERLDLLLEGCV